MFAGVCASASTDGNAAQEPAAVPVYGYEVVNSWPHDATAFTQGLVFKDNVLYESTGGNGSSSLRRIDLSTGRIEKKVDLPVRYFVEGITLLNGKIYQLTWRNRKGFIYDAASLQFLGAFIYHDEGWGLTDDGSSLIMSDGTNTLRFLDPRTFQVSRTISVYANGRPLMNLNELEHIKGEIYANVWQSDRIVRIDPESGKVLGWIDLTGLLPGKMQNRHAVLNGIAYDRAGDRIFVTGKLWPLLFEIRLKERRDHDEKR
ncbi:MAG: glutaminyl-peptide cyclotransferase [Geobacter sp.]|nr:MAG: glutaminyl-peptide cyclotransferase [Geobacter sp.]